LTSVSQDLRDLRRGSGLSVDDVPPASSDGGSGMALIALSVVEQRLDAVGLVLN
jgi:hypothetical protein